MQGGRGTAGPDHLRCVLGHLQRGMVALASVWSLEDLGHLRRCEMTLSTEQPPELRQLQMEPWQEQQPQRQDQQLHGLATGVLVA